MTAKTLWETSQNPKQLSYTIPECYLEKEMGQILTNLVKKKSWSYKSKYQQLPL